MNSTNDNLIADLDAQWELAMDEEMDTYQALLDALEICPIHMEITDPEVGCDSCHQENIIDDDADDCADLQF